MGLTVQAARVHAAIRMLRAGAELPAVVCFCGGDLAGGTLSTTGPGAALHVSPAALAYNFFRAAAEAQGVDVSRVSFIVEQRSTGVLDGVVSTALACRNRRRSPSAAGGAGAARSGSSDLPAGPLLVRLFSTDHHLQRLQDVDSLMPRLSALQALMAHGT